MKKLLLMIKRYPSVKGINGPDCGVQYCCKIIIIDTTIDEDDQEFKVITFRTNALEKQYTDLMNDLLSTKNHVYLMAADDDGNLIGNGIFNEEVNKINENHPPLKFSLTKQQKKIMDLLAEGLVFKEVAEKLNLSPHTVKHHAENAYERMEVNCRSAAVDSYLIYKKRLN